NKTFKSKQSHILSGVSIVENYLSSGRLPGRNATLSSIAKTNTTKTTSEIEQDYYEFDKKVRDTGVTVKIKILRIKDVRVDLSLGELARFESLAFSNGWTDEAMGELYYELIEDEVIKETLTKTSYKKLREELVEILHPKSEARIITTKLDTIKQQNFTTIGEFFKEIKKNVEILGVVQKLTQKEFDRILTDSFHRGLGTSTSLKILDAGVSDLPVLDIVKYLKKYEEGIILQNDLCNITLINKDRSLTQHQRSNPILTTNPSYNKWCSIHKMRSHNTRECSLNPNRTSNNSPQPTRTPEQTTRSLIITETKKKTLTAIEINGKIDSTPALLTVDSGADLNYILEKTAEDLNLEIEETQPTTLVFGGGAKETSNRKVTTNLLINGEKYYTEFLILKNLPVKLILGNDFLIRNDCRINFKQGTLQIGESNVVNLNGTTPSAEEVLEARLSEKACLTIIEAYPALNKILKHYMSVNNTFTHMNVKPATFIVKEPLPTIQSKGYPIPYKNLKRGKEEIVRLQKENIIEPSESPYTSPAFFRKKKNNDLRLILDYKNINN
ncbi:Protein DDI1 like protein 1, partial [Nosema granulosis]